MHTALQLLLNGAPSTSVYNGLNKKRRLRKNKLLLIIEKRNKLPVFSVFAYIFDTRGLTS